MLRLVEAHADHAEQFVADRLAASEPAYEESVAVRPGVAEMLAGLDGHMLRTGELVSADTDELTKVRKLKKRKRETAWRDTRVGNGLRDAVQTQFPHMQFILDKFHVVEHCGEASDAQGKSGDEKRQWIREQLASLAAGNAKQTIAALAKYTGPGQERTVQLARYLTKLASCLHYDAYQAKGWQIGSGQTESSHRTVSQKRMKLPGLWWRSDHINPMMALRVLQENGWWSDYWKSRENLRVA